MGEAMKILYGINNFITKMIISKITKKKKDR